jgi:hypothetical protein
MMENLHIEEGHYLKILPNGDKINEDEIDGISCKLHAWGI